MHVRSDEVRPVAEPPATVTSEGVAGTAEEDVGVLSLSPYPISPMLALPMSPEEAETPPPVSIPRQPAGKPRGMLAMMVPPASSPPSSETSIPELEVSPMAMERVEPPARKIQRLATFRVCTSTDVILDEKVIRHTENKDSYLKRIEQDEDLC